MRKGRYLKVACSFVYNLHTYNNILSINKKKVGELDIAQSGFRPNRSNVDQVLILDCIMKQGANSMIVDKEVARRRAKGELLPEEMSGSIYTAFLDI